MNGNVLGIELNGVCDAWSSVEISESPVYNHGMGVVPSLVVTPRTRGEKPLAGLPALQSITGKGWTWPQDAAGPDKDGLSRRIPVLSILKLLSSGKKEIEADRDSFFSVSDLLASHLSSITRTKSSSCVVTVPDHSDETSQQRILDSRYDAGFDQLRLLWRPIASLFYWGNCLLEEQLRVLNGSEIMVIYVGPMGFEVSILKLETQPSSYGPLLTPIRSNSGVGRSEEQFTIGDVAEFLSRKYASEIGDDSLSWQMIWGTPYIWRKLLGLENAKTLFQKSNGEFLQIGHSREDIDQSMLGKITGSLDRLLDKFGSSRLTQLQHVLISGCFYELSDTLKRSLKSETTNLIKKRIGNSILIHDVSHDPRVKQYRSPEAMGSAIYAWRLAMKLPTYYDFLPQLEINATSDDRPDFIPLIPKQTRIEGGKSFRHDVTQPFFIPSGAPQLEFYIYKEGDQVRKTTTPLKESPRRETPVKLVVRQTPGQGHAIVEIWPDTPGIFGPRTLTLDWETLTPTSKDRQEILSQLSIEAGVCYPEHAPVRNHEKMWISLDVESVFTTYLRIDHGHDNKKANLYANALSKLFDVVRTKRRGSLLGVSDDTHSVYSVVSSDGETPQVTACSREQQGLFFSSKNTDAIARTVMTKVEEEFAFFLSNRIAYKRSARIQRLFLIATWCYSSAPKNVVDYLLDYINDPSNRPGVQAEAASRCVTSADEIKRFCSSLEHRFDENEINQKWVKGLTQIFQFREKAPELLNDLQATKFTLMALREIANGISSGIFKTRFLWGVQLLMLIFRYRMKRKDFLKSDSVEFRALHQIVRQLLSKALDSVRKKKKIARYIEESIRMLDYQGTNQLIARELASDLSGPETPDENGETQQLNPLTNVKLQDFHGNLMKALNDFEQTLRPESISTHSNYRPPIEITDDPCKASVKTPGLKTYSQTKKNSPSSQKQKPSRTVLFTSTSRASIKQVPSTEEIEFPLLRTVYEAGGKISLSDAVKPVGTSFKLPVDQLVDQSSDLHARLLGRIRFAAFNLIKQGLLEKTLGENWQVSVDGLIKLRKKGVI